jgi:dipeptidyl aminopeptidase/acylaminoacyl peptidase
MNWASPVAGNTADEIYAIGEVRREELASLKGDRQNWEPHWNGIAAYELDFSRDGKRVAYVHYPDHRLCIAAADGSNRVQLAGVDFEAHQPHWSPDGTRIAFMGRLEGKWRVVVVDAETDRWEQLVPGGPDQGVPTWTGDGQVVYGDFPNGDAHRIMKLHFFDPRTHKGSVLPGSEGLWTLRCSPDGKYLAALRQDSTALLISRWGSSEWRQILTSNNLDDLNWSADSQRLLILRSRHLLTTLDFSGKHVRQIADVATFPYASEQWFGLAPDGSVLGLRGGTAKEVYSVRWQP